MNQNEIMYILEQRYIKQGYIKQGSIIIDFFPKNEIENLVSRGLVEIRNSIIPTVTLSSEQREKLYKENKIKWHKRF